MTMGSGGIGDDAQMERPEHWRDRVVDRLSLALCVLSGFGLPVILVQFDAVLSWLALASAVAWVIIAAAVLLRTQLPFVVRALLLLGTLFISFIAGSVLVGPLFGPGLSGGLMVLLAAVIFGRSAGLLALGVCLAALIAMGLAVASGWMEPPSPDVMSMAGFGAWGREAVAFAFLGTVAVLAASYVMTRIEGSLKATAAALAQAEAQEREKEVARAALMEAERAVSELQRVEALGRLAGGVAHDFNNALLVLLTGIEELQDDPSADHSQVLRDMHHAAEGAAQLTAQLLAYGRRDVAAPRPLDPRSVVESTVRSLRRVLPDDLEFVVDIEDPPPIVADPRQLEQLLLNLVINARDAMPTGGTLTLAASRVDVDGEDWLRLAVTDTGVGIDPTIRSRIFEPFFTTKKQGEGTGLGLSTVHGIAQRAGGDIRVHSNGGGGTTFEVLLPACELPAASDPVLAAAVPPRGSGVVLVAEDDAVVRNAVVRSLRRAGYTTIEGQNAPSAIEAMRRHPGPVDLLCTDGVMAGGSGAELVDAFRVAFPGAPILVCSGHLEEELVRRDISTGSVSFLPKPFRGDELVRRVNGLLEPAGTGPSSG